MWLSSKESACQGRRHALHPWVGKIPWRKKWLPTPSILAWRIPWTEEPCGLQSMGLRESDMIWWLNNLTTVPRKGLQKAGGYLRQPKPHTWDCLPPKVPSLLFLPWSITFKANFSSFPPSDARISILTASVLKFPCFQSILHTTGLLKTHPTASILRLDLWVVLTTLSHCPSHCITSGFWKTPSSPLASVSPLLSLPVHSASFSSDSTPSDPITLGDAARGGVFCYPVTTTVHCLPRVYHKWSLCTASNSWVCVPSM